MLIIATTESAVEDSDMSDLGEVGTCCDTRRFTGEQVDLEPTEKLAPSIRACPIAETAD
jgi:hypothetical protein